MYSIQQDPPWIQKPFRGSLAPSASVYSDDDDEYEATPRLINHPDMPEIAPLRLQKKPSYHTSYHAHHNQHVKDSGPQVRQSRLPIFKQVRGLLNRPLPPLNTSNRNVKYDDFSGDISDSGKAPDVKPSTYRNPYEGTFEVRRDGRSVRKQHPRPHTGRSLSPISVLNDHEISQMSSPDLEWDSEVSPVDDTDHMAASKVTLQPSHTQNHAAVSETSLPVRTNLCAQDKGSETSHVARIEHVLQRAPTAPTFPLTPAQQTVYKPIKRKPAPKRRSLSPENAPPQSSHGESGDYDGTSEVAEAVPTSHFSWTTGAPSIAPTVATFDTSNPASRYSNQSYGHRSRQSNQSYGQSHPQSRFSWSTVNTHMTAHARPESPPPSPPPILLPTKYKTPPVQSILSRHRPIQRIEREEWTPPTRKASLPDPGITTPTSAKSRLSITSHQIGNHGAGKKLPPPPELLTPVSPLSHLDTLLREEQDKLHQRKNIEHLIADLVKVEKASPLEVSYAQVKDADRKLKELRTTLAEVQLEERELGIAISRARRKEGEDEGLWVRRVTG